LIAIKAAAEVKSSQESDECSLSRSEIGVGSIEGERIGAGAQKVIGSRVVGSGQKGESEAKRKVKSKQRKCAAEGQIRTK
jgi:hypothetical protein